MVQNTERNTQEVFSGAISQNIERKISDEKIRQGFATIDSHTRFLDNMTIINNLNMSVQVISGVVLSIDGWNSSEDKALSLFKEYLDVMSDDSNHIDEELERLIKDYVIFTCMVYYAVSKKDKSRLKTYNTAVSDSVKNILRKINNASSRNGGK